MRFNDITLNIAENAIKKEEKVKVYITTILNEKVNILKPMETLLSPIVFCGPPGTVFNKPCLLSFPHNIVNENIWKFKGLVKDKPGGKWKEIDDEEDFHCYVENGRCFIELKHFTYYALAGGASGNTSGGNKVKPVHMKVLDNWHEYLPDTYEICIEIWRKDRDKPKDLKSIYYTYPLSENCLNISVQDISQGWQALPEKLSVDKALIWKRYSGIFTLRPGPELRSGAETKMVERPCSTVCLKQNDKELEPVVRVPQSSNFQGPERKNQWGDREQNMLQNPADRSNIKMKFMMMRSNFCKQYTGMRYKWLRFLLSDFLPIRELSDDGDVSLALINNLSALNYISCTNVIILSEIAELTKLVSAKSCIDEYKSFIDCEEGKRLSQYRRTLYKALTNIADSDLPTLIAQYDLTHSNKFESIWDLVFHLEKERYLDDTQENWQWFAGHVNGTAQEIMLGKTKAEAESALSVTQKSIWQVQTEATKAKQTSTTSATTYSLCQDTSTKDKIETSHMKTKEIGLSHLGEVVNVKTCNSEKRYLKQIVDVISQLNLQDFYPGKITCEKALEFSTNSISPDIELVNEEKIPWIMLQSLLMCNYNGRYLVSPKKTVPIDLKSNQVSPADTLIALFLCSDNFLRQLLVEKMSRCQLAIPLLLPCGGTDGPSWEVLLWALSTVRKQWKDSTGTTFEKSMVVHPMPVVSVVRLGKTKISKSRILNSLLLGYIQHDMFFHYECEGGSVDRKLCEGLVEIGWYLPSGKHNAFPYPVTFLNLRGNASHLKKHTSFLSEISDVSIGFTSSNTFKEEDAVVLESIYRQNDHVMLAIDCQPKKKLLESINQLNKKYPHRHIGLIDISNKNDLDISKQIWEHLCPLINISKRSVPDRSIEECANIFTTHGFSVDEHTPDCFQAKAYTTDMLKYLNQFDKKQHLPLQVIAMEIGDKRKEEFQQKLRGNKSTEMYADEMQRSVCSLRQNQKASYKNVSKIFKSYENSFRLPRLTRKYFCRYVKILTGRYSFETLQPVREEYIKKWNELCEARKRHSEREKKVENLKRAFCEAEDKDERTYFDIDDHNKNKVFQGSLTKQNELVDLEIKLTELSLGIEHFNREIGQVYEMISYLKLANSAICKLPDVVAEMLLDGHPLELMDGDSSHIPLPWIEAVFDCLRNLIGANKKMFVLSVVGNQSSGKSTMLNAMFGLQFAVKAGRCTKGIFAKLVKVDTTIRQETNYDYILVVDTEGLRSKELKKINLNKNVHDSKLATLVIGISDVTIINIMGENISDMQDTLQILVHAFMKMHIVKIKTRCMFVHHDVTDVAASHMNAIQKRKLTEMLDEVTKCAAKEQNCIDRYQRFSDIIQFQENKDVMYVSSLWQENPPTALPNPYYSGSIVKVKENIIEFMKVSQPKGMLEFKLRLSSVCKAVVCEDFVFSFRNEIEIITHNALETEYVKHSRKVRSSALLSMHILQEQCKTLTVEEIHSVGVCLLNKQFNQLEENMNTFRETMEKYFNENIIICQWKDSTEKKMHVLNTELKNQLSHEFKIIKCKIKARVEIDRNAKEYKKQIIKKAKDLGSRFRNQNLSETHLKDIFDLEWENWISEVETISTPHIDLTFENVVRESFKQCECTERLSNVSVNCNCFVSEEDINQESTLTTMRSMITNQGESKHTNLDKSNAIALQIRQTVFDMISDHSHNGETYSQTFVMQLLDTIQEQVNSETENCKFKVNAVVGIILRIFCSLRPVLNRLQERHINETDPRVNMENQRKHIWNSLKNECNTGGNTVIKIALTVTDVLETALSKSLPHLYKIGVLDHMSTSRFFVNKMSFQAQMLIDLAEKEDFQEYRPYLANPFECMKSYIKKFIKKQASDDQMVFQDIYCKNVQAIFRKIKRAVKITSHQKCKSDLKGWWEQFSENICADLVVDKELIYLSDYRDYDVESLEEKLLDKLEVTEEKLRNEFNTFWENFDEVFDQCQLFFEKDLLGCQELCPFCKAPCDLQTEEDEHRTSYHRPQGVAGYFYNKSRKLAVELCTTDVSTRRKCTNEKLYKRYQEVNNCYKSWKIQPMVGEPQLYWKWFMKTFNEELAEYYAVEPADIPEGWKDISWESAKKDMIKTYNL